VAQLTFQRARTEETKRQRAAAIVEAARSLALDTGVASVTLTGVADRAGVHYSAVRRYFSSHKEVLLHLTAEGWTRWSNTVCAALRDPGPMSPSRVAETLRNGLAADPLFCDLLGYLSPLADVLGQELPVLGHSDARNVLLAACSLAGSHALASRYATSAQPSKWQVF